VIGLDTNVLLRFLVADDARQTERAHRVIREHCHPDAPGYVNHVVLCELIWVLERSYGYPRPAVATVAETLCRSGDFSVQDSDAVREALDAFRASQADFADCLIGVVNRRHGCRNTVTFDREAAKLAGFELV